MCAVRDLGILIDASRVARRFLRIQPIGKDVNDNRPIFECHKALDLVIRELNYTQIPAGRMKHLWWSPTSELGLGCVKTRLGKGGAELFSQLPSSESGCQHNRLLHRRNRDGSSTRKLDIGVFTQPGSIASFRPCAGHFRSSPLSGRFRCPPACFKGATSGLMQCST